MPKPLISPIAFFFLALLLAPMGVLEVAAQTAADSPDAVTLWSGDPLPKTADLPALKNVRFSVIKPYEFSADGYRFLHGVALAWHHGKLYASFGNNKGGENTGTEEARFRVSEDGGQTWSAVATIDTGDEPDLAVSHGVFLPLNGRLWAFHGAYTGTMQHVHTRAYLLDEATGVWQRRGVVIQGGFWPLGEPQRMEDGNWILAGIRTGGDAAAGGTHPAAVAISHGDDVTQWDLVVIPAGEGLGEMWGESAVIVDGKRITNIARYGQRSVALVSFSEDYGRTWTPSLPSNLPMTPKKPCAGTLSSGQRFLICSNPMTSLVIYLSEPGGDTFSKMFVIRHALFPDGPGESHKNAYLTYPSAVEHEGHLYVGYSNRGGNVGRTGQGRELWNNNSAELAVIPLSSLAITP